MEVLAALGRQLLHQRWVSQTMEYTSQSEKKLLQFFVDYEIGLNVTILKC